MENISKLEIVDSPEALQQSMQAESAPVEQSPVQDNVPPAVPQPEPTIDNQPQAPQPEQPMESTPYVDPEPALYKKPLLRRSIQNKKSKALSSHFSELGRDVAV